MAFVVVTQCISGIVDAIAISYQRRYNKLHRSIYGLSYDLYVLDLISHCVLVYCTLHYLFSPLVKLQLSIRYPLFYPYNTKNAIPVSLFLLLKDLIIIAICIAVLRQLITYRMTKHIHQSISKVCLSMILLSAAFGTFTYAFACSNLPDNNSGTFGVFYIEHINYLWVIGNTLQAFKFLPQMSLNWFGMSTVGVSSKYVVISFLNKLMLLIFTFCYPESTEYYNIPFNVTPLPVLFIDFVIIAVILYQAQCSYQGKKPRIPKGR